MCDVTKGIDVEGEEEGTEHRTLGKYFGSKLIIINNNTICLKLTLTNGLTAAKGLGERWLLTTGLDKDGTDFNNTSCQRFASKDQGG